MTSEYYRVVKPVDPRPPVNYELYAEEYRNFLVARAHSEYMLWEVKTLENGVPPTLLRGNFTTSQKAKDHIDRFWEKENEREAREQ